jgi:psiF repeat
LSRRGLAASFSPGGSIKAAAPTIGAGGQNLTSIRRKKSALPLSHHRAIILGSSASNKTNSKLQDSNAEGTSMLRYAPALVTVLLLAAMMLAEMGAPASAVTPAEKMETCKFGADADKLTGAKRKRFLSRCMADAPAKAAKKQQAK